MVSYRINLDSIRRAFPPGTDAPPLLVDFAAWLKGRPWGSVGCFDLVGQFSDDAPIVDGSPLRRDFALFARLPEGSAVGTWLASADPAAGTPIVVLGSEGQHRVLAASIDALLAKIAVGWFAEHGEWTDFAPHEDADDATDELADWLDERLAATDLEILAEDRPSSADFASWMHRWCCEREDYWAAHPAMSELAKHLVAHRPQSKQPWGRTIFEIAIAGRQFQARVLRRGRQPIDEAAAVEPILRGLRDEMWRAQPDLGLWHAMSFRMFADGRILPRFDYELRPDIDGAPADLGEARADLARAPRPARWVPVWLTGPQALRP